MLKTQFTKAFYLCNSFLLITVSFTPYSPVSSPVEKKDSKKEISITRNIRNAETIKGIHNFIHSPEITLNRNGVYFVKKYIKTSKESLVSVKQRSKIPFSIIDSVFHRYRLPVELKYLAVIESELNSNALSHVGARGPWQFMPSTAHILGLKITRHSDDRTNYYKSSIAAARYLRDLYTQFDDWLLVLAAYNSGPGPVCAAIRKSGSRNFWVLQNYLPAESRDHVKKFIATHYFFEGRGSETTLTRAENAKFKKMIRQFIRSGPAPEINQPARPESQYKNTNATNLMENFDIRQLTGFHPCGSEYDLQKNQVFALLPESAEEKFRRLMRESEECIKKSRKII